MTSDYSQTGINIEHQAIFSSGGNWYYFYAVMTNPNVGVEMLDNKNIDMFEYTNEINSLCLYGSITYHDFSGNISKYFNRVDNHLNVYCQQLRQVRDGSAEMFVNSDRKDGADTFSHIFIVQNMKILERNAQRVTYRISLVSSAWYLLCSKITFSNYSQDPVDAILNRVGFSSNINDLLKNKDKAEQLKVEEKPRNGFLILKKFLVDALKENNDSFSVDVDSFDACAATSPNVDIPYITNGSDNVFTAKKYIFDRMYWNKKKMEQSLKFIVFSPVKNLYRCVDYHVDASWFPCLRPMRVLSMFETNYEESIFGEKIGMESNAQLNQTSLYEDLFEHVTWEYSESLNRFFTDNSISQKTMSNLYNDKADVFKSMLNVTTEKKYTDELRSDWFKNANTYYNQSPDWNRTFSIYQNMIDNMLKRDSLILSLEGDLTHQPGCCIHVNLDRTQEKLPDLTPEQREQLYEKFRQYEGMFPILKVQHCYAVGSLGQRDTRYFEKVYLGRNFLLPPGKPTGPGGWVNRMVERALSK